MSGLNFPSGVFVVCCSISSPHCCLRSEALIFFLCVRELVKLQLEAMSAQTALDQKRLARHNLLLACKIQSLPITLLSGSLDEIIEMQVGHKVHCLFWITILTPVELKSEPSWNKDLRTPAEEMKGLYSMCSFYLLTDSSAVCSWTQNLEALQPPWTSLRERRNWSSTTPAWQQKLGWDIKHRYCLHFPLTAVYL